MPATPINPDFSPDDFKERADYSDLVGDFEATCTDVEDVTAGTGNPGWKFTFVVEGLNVYSRVWHRGGGKWKIREVFNALGSPLNLGDDISVLDPNALIGRSCILTLVQTDADEDGNQWTNVTRHTPIVTEDAGGAVSL